MFELFPLGHRGGHWSDRHGVIERHPTLAISARVLDPGDRTTHGAVTQHGEELPPLGQRGAAKAVSRHPTLPHGLPAQRRAFELIAAIAA
jgi:hypothetical protein